ncbi:hypothetical protein, partial [Prescottella soli]
MANQRSQLILNYPKLDERVNLLFEDMSSSRALRESFLRDPTGVVWASVFGGDPATVRTKLSNANKLLYCFLADPGMRQWADEYSAQLAQQFQHLHDIRNPIERKREFLLQVDRSQVARDFAAALVRVGGPELQTAVVDNEGSIDPVGPLAAVAGPVVAAVPVLVVAYVGLFIAVETEFAVHQHNAIWGPEPGP